MPDFSKIPEQISPWTVQAQLPKLDALDPVDRVAFLELTALSTTRFNPLVAQNILRAYLAAGSRYALSPYKLTKYSLLRNRILEDFHKNLNPLLAAWYLKQIELDLESRPPIVVADNIAQYIITDIAGKPSELDTLLRKLVKTISS